MVLDDKTLSEHVLTDLSSHLIDRETEAQRNKLLPKVI